MGTKDLNNFFQLLKPKEARLVLIVFVIMVQLSMIKDDIVKDFAQFYKNLFSTENNQMNKSRARDYIKGIVPRKFSTKDAQLLDRELSLE